MPSWLKLEAIANRRIQPGGHVHDSCYTLCYEMQIALRLPPSNGIESLSKPAAKPERFSSGLPAARFLQWYAERPLKTAFCGLYASFSVPDAVRNPGVFCARSPLGPILALLGKTYKEAIKISRTK
jgi:hypothetical protein